MNKSGLKLVHLNCQVCLFWDEKLYVGRNDKGRSVFTSRKIRKGEIICNYDGEVCTYKELKERKKIHVVWGWELHFRIQISREIVGN